MAVPKTVSVQNDFSAGEVDSSAKRGDADKTLRAGLRQCSNFRVLDTRKITNRQGRTAKFIDGPRVDEVLMSPGNVFELCFSAGRIRVRNTAGAQVFTSTVLGDGVTAVPWTALNVNQIVWDTLRLAVYIAFPGMVPQVLSWDGVATWTLSTFAEATFGSQKRTPFYRLAPPNITLRPSAITGTVNLAFVGGNVLVNGMIGTRIRYCGRQMTIATVASGVAGTAIVNEPLPPGMTLTTGSTVGSFNVGDVILGATSGAKGIVTTTPATQQINFTSPLLLPSNFQIGDAITGSTSGAAGTVVGQAIEPGTGRLYQINVLLAAGPLFVAAENIGGPHTTGAVNSGVSGATLTVQIILNDAGQAATFIVETVAGPSGTAAVSAVAVAAPQAVAVWDQEVMNAFQGWPSSVFVDQNRLGLCNFPSLPNGIAWSAINSPADFDPDDASSPDNAIFELAPGKGRVLYVAAGAESSEFVFLDNGVFYIPITPTNPLKSGSVGFNRLSGEGASSVQPRLVQEIMVYVPAGGSTMRAITATGAYQRPYEVKQISKEHDHLFGTIVAIAAPGASDPNFPEQYFYVLNASGTVAVAKIMVENGQITGELGWSPVTGVGAVNWVSSRLGTATVWFTTTYPTGPVTLAEMLDATQYLDAALPVNNVPAALAPPGGKGPLWWYAGGSVTLMDQGTRWMGTYQVDANGFIVPQFLGGENLNAATLVAGQTWTATHERFVPGVQEGPEGQGGPQRMRKRRIARNVVYVANSTGFVVQSLKGGVPWAQRRIEAFKMGEDVTLPPKLREEAYEFRFKGRSHDPRQVIVKDTPGPLTILEHTLEVTF